MLSMRMIGQYDYSVREDGQRISRIRFASERTPGIWLWNIQVNIPGPPFGSAGTLDDAKQDFKTAWLAFAENGKAGGGVQGDERAEDALAEESGAGQTIRKRLLIV
jgi:hypothetical protein